MSFSHRACVAFKEGKISLEELFNRLAFSAFHSEAIAKNDFEDISAFLSENGDESILFQLMSAYGLSVENETKRDDAAELIHFPDVPHPAVTAATHNAGQQGWHYDMTA